MGTWLSVRFDKSAGKVGVLLLLAALGCGDEGAESVRDPGVSSDESDARGSVREQSDVDVPEPRAQAAVDAGSASKDGGPTVDAGSPVDAEREALRQLCVDEINRYRATVGAAPLERATDREACSDRGAEADGDTGRAHASAGAGGRNGANGLCPQSAQNTCPGWGVGPRTGNATVADALKSCLKMMWAEGPAPAGNCSGVCFQQHGHYLNMSAPRTKRVACGFYKMKNGSYWMNQNFW